jgi:hypothetical protein
MLGVLVLLPAGVYDVQRARHPFRRDDAAPIVRDFLAAHDSSSVMYVMGHAAPAWIFYSALWRQRDGEPFRVAAQRAMPSGNFPHRACMTQAPGLRVVFGQIPQSYLTDSTLAGEAAWLAAQPERDVWLLTVKYERRAGDTLTSKLLARGATKLEERTREGASLRHFRFPVHGDEPPRASAANRGICTS